MAGRQSTPRSALAQPDLFDRMLAALAQHKVGADAGRRDVLAQVLQIDVAPDLAGAGERLLLRHLRIETEIGARIIERGLAQAGEALQVPGLELALRRIDIEREIEEIRYEQPRGPGRLAL